MQGQKPSLQRRSPSLEEEAEEASRSREKSSCKRAQPASLPRSPSGEKKGGSTPGEETPAPARGRNVALLSEGGVNRGREKGRIGGEGPGKETPGRDHAAQGSALTLREAIVHLLSRWGHHLGNSELVPQLNQAVFTTTTIQTCVSS